MDRHDNDPDETEGRKLYREQAEALAKAQAAMSKRRVKMSKPTSSYGQ